jgi:hypothetical protein
MFQESLEKIMQMLRAIRFSHDTVERLALRGRLLFALWE